MSAIDLELILGGLLTGGIIGFLWQPDAAILALLAAVVLVVSLSEWHHGGAPR